MPHTLLQLEPIMARNDRQKMLDFIAWQLPDGEASLLLASGPGGDITANVLVQGDNLEITSNCPEWVTLREVYEHLRWRAIPRREQWEQLRAVRMAATDSPRFTLESLAQGLQGVLAGLKGIHSQQGVQGITSLAAEPSASPEQFLRIRDVASLLGCSYSEARDRMLDGRIQAIRDGRWLRTRREWVDEYVTQKLVKATSSTPEIHVVRVRKQRKGQAIFRKDGMGYEFLKERQQNQKQQNQG